MTKDEDILELEEALTDVGQMGQKNNKESRLGKTGSSDIGGGNTASGASSTGSRPDFRVVQPVTDREGKSTYVNVGAMWKNISKNGKEFYILKIGNLKLLVFPQDR